MLRSAVFCLNAASRLKLCIVGAGPAGLYTAERLLRRFREDSIEIDFLERLPFPFGLVETGVAPDHPATKNVRTGFTKTLQQPQCRFFGNVLFGKDVTLTELRELYHGVVLACGAEADRKLQVQGEHGRGVISAREFVWWYNGHPDCTTLPVELAKIRRVAIIGAGNVALDCARILLKPANVLEKTDMASHAVSALRRSAVEDVYIIARRGVAHVKFTPKELKEILELPETRYGLKPSDLELSTDDAKVVSTERRRKRVLQIFHNGLKRIREDRVNDAPFRRTLHFEFQKRLEQIQLTADGAVQEIALLDANGERERLEVDLVISSIGTRAEALPGVPFDAVKSVIPSYESRVLDRDSIIEGLYVCGWLRRGATGIIGTNILDAEDVAEAVFQDRSQLKAPLSTHTLPALLTERGVRWVDADAWLKLLDYERIRGRARGIDREKLTSVEAMLDICFNDRDFRCV